jgi:hypothetical protein
MFCPRGSPQYSAAEDPSTAFEFRSLAGPHFEETGCYHKPRGLSYQHELLLRHLTSGVGEKRNFLGRRALLTHSIRRFHDNFEIQWKVANSLRSIKLAFPSYPFWGEFDGGQAISLAVKILTRRKPMKSRWTTSNLEQATYFTPCRRDRRSGWYEET